MNRLPHIAIGFVLVLAFASQNAYAQHFRNLFDPCPTCRPNICNTCGVAATACGCSAQPVVSTTYRQEPYVTYRDVQQTVYRPEPEYKQVPVTAYKNVTVDEGGYQKVWVPKLVHKQVPETQYRTQVTYKNVPYQVSQRIPEWKTRSVPQQTVQYVPQPHQTAGCFGCLPNAGVPYYGTTATAPFYSRTAAMTPPVTATVPATPSPAESTGANRPVPDPRHLEPPAVSAEADWSTVKSRSAQATTVPRSASRSTDPLPRSRAVRTPSRPIPSAAAVWRSRY